MFRFSFLKNIKPGVPTRSGHVCYLDAVYHTNDIEPKAYRVIYKENKRGFAVNSQLEVAFTRLAQLFLNKNLTAHQDLVKDDEGNITGVMTQHMCYDIAKKEGTDKDFYTLGGPKPEILKSIAKPEDIPLYFLDKLSQNDMANLVLLEKKHKLTIDYDSIASVLASSYTLEEDDLHKGNFGFYLVRKDEKPHVVFFKIDHDLMFIDSIMSFHGFRFRHSFDDELAFAITKEDLLSFPRLKISMNSYWPTRTDFFVNILNKNKYPNEQEINFFSSCANHPEFKNAKWRVFYKHILLPVGLIKSSLAQCFDESNPEERAQLHLILQATVARQARLRSVLYSIPEFRKCISQLTQKDDDVLLNEAEVSPVIAHIVFEEGDTPLHAAIRLGDYRYEETLQYFAPFINQKNKAGKTPLDVAMELFDNTKQNAKDVRQDLCFIMKHLVLNGAEKSPKFIQFNKTARVESYHFKTPYLNAVKNAKTYEMLKNILQRIGEDHRFCLKSKKKLSIVLVCQFIKTHQNHPGLKDMLKRLRNEMNGLGRACDCAPLKFIRQLRSKLWIVRVFRGSYGRSSTLSEINSIIGHALNHRDEHQPNPHKAQVPI